MLYPKKYNKPQEKTWEEHMKAKRLIWNKEKIVYGEYTIHCCAHCEDFIDGDEIKMRTQDGWLPFHRACAPEFEELGHGGFRIFGGC